MAWGQVKVEEQRKKFIDIFLSKEKNFSDVCRDFKISRKTGYKWVERYQQLGIEGLYDQSTAPHSRPNTIEDWIVHQIIEVRIKYPKWGPKKVFGWLINNKPNIDWPPASSIGNIFDRYGLTVPRKLRKKLAVCTAPLDFSTELNDVWSFDFKGTMWTADNAKNDPFTLTDNTSRFIIKCQILPANSGKYVWHILESAFKEFGLPNCILSDNGPPFATMGAGRLSKVSINMIKAGVLPSWITPGRPQQNGRHERMHGTLEREIDSAQISSKIGLNQKLKEFQNYFNYERPHESLNQKTPGSVYKPSNRVWSGELQSPEYNNDYIIRKVQKDGTINYKGKRIFVSETLWGEPVGFIEKDSLELYYGRYY